MKKEKNYYQIVLFFSAAVTFSAGFNHVTVPDTCTIQVPHLLNADASEDYNTMRNTLIDILSDEAV
jgi:hypothetical protein